MNFFNNINSAVNKINYYGNQAHIKNWMPDHITQLIKTCNYTDE